MSSSNKQWLSFIEENLLDEWPPQPILLISPGLRKESVFLDSASAPTSRKRQRDERSSSSSSTKACREKMRRDKLNDKFMELSTLLEPGRPVKSDKSTILVEAACVVQHLREEVRNLRTANEKLREAVQDLKTEKNELREEKLRLKAEKEKLEAQLKSLSNPATSVQAAAAAALFPQPSITAKLEPGEYPHPVAMWQWMSSSLTDTSQDHVLRPPVA